MADADEAKKPSLLHEMEGLRAEKAQAETADDLDAFAAGNERLGEWLTVSKQYLYLVALTMKGAKERYGEPDEKTLERIRYELGTIEWMAFRATSSLCRTSSAPHAKWAYRSDRAAVRCRLRRGILSEDNEHRPP